MINFCRREFAMRIIVRAPRFIAAAAVALLAFAALGMSAAYAQQSGTPTAASPAQLLQQYPNGGTALSNAIEQLLLSDSSKFQAFLDQLKNANDQQRAAMGDAFAKAAKIKVLTDQALALEWQRLIAEINDPSFKTAALNAFGDVQLGSIGGAAGGDAGAGLGGPGAGAGTTSGQTTSTTTPPSTQFFTFSAGTTSATSLTNSVSPGGI
jgi:hypothetical protein